MWKLVRTRDYLDAGLTTSRGLAIEFLPAIAGKLVHNQFRYYPHSVIFMNSGLCLLHC
jgi:hypothetical protein